MNLQESVELRMNGLCVAVPGALDHEGHSPGRKRGKRVPVPSIAEDDPKRGIKEKHGERAWSRGKHADIGQPGSDFARGHGDQRTAAFVGSREEARSLVLPEASGSRRASPHEFSPVLTRPAYRWPPGRAHTPCACGENRC